MVDLDARPPSTAFSERVGLHGVRYMEIINNTLFNLSKGRVGGSIWGSPVIQLHVSGRRTGVRRTKPLLALRDGDDWIVVASRGGTRSNPEWFENLVAYEAQAKGRKRPSSQGGTPLEAPEVSWEGGHRAAVRAKLLTGKERDRWWARMVAIYPKFESYQARTTTRVIPVVRLSRVH